MDIIFFHILLHLINEVACVYFNFEYESVKKCSWRDETNSWYIKNVEECAYILKFITILKMQMQSLASDKGYESPIYLDS